MTYRIRFWYWHQEVVLTGITPEELVASVYFQEDYDHPVEWFSRRAWVYGCGGKRYEIEVTVAEGNPTQLLIGHIEEGTEDKIDVNLGDKGGWSLLDDSYWTIEPEDKYLGVDLGTPEGDKTVVSVFEKICPAKKTAGTEEEENIKITSNLHFKDPSKFYKNGNNRL